MTKINDRIKYLEQEVASGSRLDGYTLKGLREELRKLKPDSHLLVGSKKGFNLMWFIICVVGVVGVICGLSLLYS